MSNPGSYLLPFAVGLAIPLAPRAQTLRLTLESVPPSRPLARASALLDLWIAAADLGLFSGRDAEAGRSYMRVAGQDATATGEIRIRIECAGIDAGAYRVLLNLLAQCRHADEPIARLDLRAENDPGSAGASLGDILRRPCAPHVDSPPFALMLPRPLEDADQPVVRLQFARALTKSDFEHVAFGLDVWDRSIASQGFTETFDPREVEPPASETYMLSPDTVEHPCQGSAEHPVAYDALINLAIRLGSTLGPLSALEID